MIIIRNMELKDLDQVVQMEENMFSHPWSRKDFQESIENEDHIYLIAENDSQIVGYCGMWCVSGEGQVYNVAVHSGFRGMQIGYKMLSQLIVIGKKRPVNAYTLEVRVGNKPAIALYEKLGFSNYGIRKKFYQNPTEDAMIMWLYE